MRDIGKNIRDLRQQKEMTQEELAEKLFVTRQTISNYEQGKTRPDIDMLVKLAEALDEDVKILLYGIPVLQNRKHRLLRFFADMSISFCLIFIYRYLYQLALVHKLENFDTQLLWWVLGIAKPLLSAVLGWILMDILDILIKIPRFHQKASIYARLTIILVCLGYLVLLTPCLLSWDVSPSWRRTVFLVLGTTHGHSFPDCYLFVALIAGSLSWLSKSTSQKASE